MRRFVVLFLLLLFLQLAVVAGGNATRYFVLHQAGEGNLLDYQIGKIEKARDIDTIFVGDSSLGNAVDAALFDALAGTRSLNLALDGDYGYAGAFNMIERALSRQPLRNVVVMNTLDMMTRPLSFDGYVLTMSALPQVAYLWDGRLGVLKTIAARLLDYRTLAQTLALAGRTRGHAVVDPRLDYIPQRPDKPAGPIPQQFAIESLNPDKRLFLDHIGRLCRARELRCLYVHGPYFGAALRQSAAYVRAVNAIVESSGLTVIDPGLDPLDEESLGDTPDHVHPAAKARYTGQLVSLLKPYLQ